MPRPDRALVSLLVAASLLAACGRPGARAELADWHGAVLDTAYARPDFTLRTLDGQPYDFRRATAGRVTLLFFGYTHCPDVCPIHLANIAAVLGKMPVEDARAIDVVFVTTDPKRDTPDVMRAWLANFDRRFIGLTGTPEALVAAQKAAHVLPAAADTAADSNYTVAHAAQVLAITADDSVHVVYPFGTRQGDWAADLPKLLRRHQPPVQIAHAFMFAPLGDEAALYADLTNRGAETDTLETVETPFASGAVLHGTAGTGVSATMTPAGALVLPRGATVRLRSGGLHVMFTQLRSHPAAGDTVNAIFVFSNAGRRAVRIPVRRYGDERED